MSQVSKSYQDLATIDALRDMKYPSCAYFGTSFAYIRMRMRVPKLYYSTGVFYIRRGLRVVGSIRLGNATASIGGTGKCKFHAFLLCLIGLENSPVSKNIYV